MTFYINSTSFSTATTVYSDSILNTVSADGYYSDGTIYRRQLDGILLDVIPCTL